MDKAAMAEICPESTEKTICEGDHAYLKIDITVPKLAECSGKGWSKINAYYDDVVKTRMKYAEGELLRKARRSCPEYLASIGMPPWRYEVRYVVLRNSGGLLALYWDCSEVIPGEETVTARHVDNWNLNTGLPEDLMINRKGRKALIRTLSAKAAERYRRGELYPGPERGVKKHFRAENCALTEKGLTVYFPLYSLAPGFTEFKIDGSLPKGCR
jgi:hypothetical protein